MDLNHQEKSLHSRKPSTPKKTPFGVEVQVTSVKLMVKTWKNHSYIQNISKCVQTTQKQFFTPQKLTRSDMHFGKRQVATSHLSRFQPQGPKSINNIKQKHRNHKECWGRDWKKHKVFQFMHACMFLRYYLSCIFWSLRFVYVLFFCFVSIRLLHAWCMHDMRGWHACNAWHAWNACHAWHACMLNGEVNMYA